MGHVERLLDAVVYAGFDRLMQLQMTAPVHFPAAAAQQPQVLYIHVPFCESLCPFCSFHRVLLDAPLAQRYFRALRKELRAVADKGYLPSIVYVGGGTPTVLPDELVRTLELARALFPVAQVSVETNPNHLHEEVFQALESAGVDRLSVGVQSFDDELLGAMGRYHPYGSGAHILERLQQAQGRFGTLNADMIFNLPRQGRESLQRDIELLRDQVGIDQVSFYPLMASRRTRSAMRRSMGEYSLDNERACYDLIRDGLDPDYALSSVWCFSRHSGMIDEYIISDTSYIGVGSGSFSYLGGTLFANTFSLRRYMQFVDERGTAATAARPLSALEQARYDLMMTLFGLSLDLPALERRHGGGFRRRLWKELLLLRLIGATRRDGERLRLTRRGQYHWVMVMRDFFTGVNNFRDQMRRHVRAELDSLLVQAPTARPQARPAS